MTRQQIQTSERKGGERTFNFGEDQSNNLLLPNKRSADMFSSDLDYVTHVPTLEELQVKKLIQNPIVINKKQHLKTIDYQKLDSQQQYSQIKAKTFELETPHERQHSNMRGSNTNTSRLDQSSIDQINSSLQIIEQLNVRKELNIQNQRIKANTTRHKRAMNQSFDDTQKTDRNQTNIKESIRRLLPETSRNEINLTRAREVMDDNYKEVTCALNLYLKEKQTSSSVTNRDYQKQRRIVKNSYQVEQQRKESLTMTQRIVPEVNMNETPSNVVRPKSLIRIPKDIILYKLSQKADRTTIESLLNASEAGTIETQSRRNPQAHGSFIDYLERESLNKTTVQSRNPEQEMAINRPKAETSLGIQKTDYLTIPTVQVNATSRNESSMKESSVSTNQAAFHITDLLEKTFRDEKNPNKAKAIIEYYKRQVRTEDDQGKQKEIMIRNYRLHVVANDKELSEKDRQLLGKNEGTTIFVNNSIIKPEVYKFSTKINSELVTTFELLERTQMPYPLRKAKISTQDIQDEQNDLDMFITQFNQKTNPTNVQEVSNFENQYFNFESPLDLNEGQMTIPITEEFELERKSTQSIMRDQVLQEFKELMDQWIIGLGSQDTVKLQPSDETLKAKKTVSPKKKPPPPVNDSFLSPRLKDINISIMKNMGKDVNNHSIIPVENFSEKSLYFSGSYNYLKRTVTDHEVKDWYLNYINKTMSIKITSDRVDQSLQTLNFMDCVKAILMMHQEFTHLDQVLFQTDNMPPELFMNYDKWIESVVRQIKKQQILANTSSSSSTSIKIRGIPAETEHFMTNGTSKTIDIKIMDYDPISAKFLVENDTLGVKTWRSRIFMRLKTDPQDLVTKQRIKVKVLMQETKEYLRLHRLISNEIMKRYPYLQMPTQVRKNIQKRVNIKPEKYNDEQTRTIALQMEALYVFSIFKSVLSSQRQDPYIKKFLAQYKIPLNSSALTYYQPRMKEKADLQNIKQFNMKETKISLDKNSLLLMDSKYIQLPIFLNSVTKKTISTHKLFRFPFDIVLLQAQGGETFKKLSHDELQKKVNTFPLHHKNFVVAQKYFSEYFHSVARYRWAESIYQEIWNFVKDDFVYETGKRITEENVDPVLRRLFHQLKLFMQTILQDHFQIALSEYLEFLLGFLLRDPDSKDSSVVQSIAQNKSVILMNKKSELLANKNLFNDINLISLKRHPFILVQAIIENQATNKYYTKMETSSKPDLDTVRKDLLSVITYMHDALKNIERVDRLVFPLLELDLPNLTPPDPKYNKDLKAYVKSIENVIDEGLRKAHEKLEEITKFMPIFEKKADGLILELKKKSFAYQNNLQDSEENSQNSDEESDSMSSDDNGSSHYIGRSAQKGGDNKDSSIMGGGPALNIQALAGSEAAFRSVEIENTIFSEELFELRRVYWQIQEEIHRSYDFGFLLLDCQPFKERSLKHLSSLIDHLEAFSRKEFLAKLNAVQQDINSVKSKLEERVQSIDDVILLLDYIEVIKKPENKVDELAQSIWEVKSKFDFIESLKIAFKSEEYNQYLTMLNWPRAFRDWLENRKLDLQSAKENLFFEMGNEKQMILDKIALFKQKIDMIKNEGLIKESELSGVVSPRGEVESPTFRRKRTLVKQGFQHQQQSIQSQVSGVTDDSKVKKDSAIATFVFIAKEILWEDYRFEPEVIEEVFELVETLKLDYDSIEKLTAQINKRETLLGVEQTEFRELRVIQDDLKPLYDLWTMAVKFSKAFPVWMEGKFDTLDSEQIENNVNDWSNELKRLSKNTFIKRSEKQMELLSFVYQALGQFKTYLPMLKALRTKGLALRHWRLIGNKLTLTSSAAGLDPATLTLWKLIGLRLYEASALAVIKGICDIATKEYAVQTTLETLEREMKATEFALTNFKDSDTLIVQRLPEVLAIFDEYTMRVSVLRTNPFVKNFYDKMLELERTVKGVVEILQEWLCFQRNWIYLENIFSLEEIQKQLDKETKKFQLLDAFFRTVVKAFEAAPQVYKGCQREGFLVQLQRYNTDCETIMKGLGEYLESKRDRFPRLYFLSNEELIEIFGKGRSIVSKPSENGRKSFLGNLFEGADQVDYANDFNIDTIISKEGESIRLLKQVATNLNTPEKWLLEFERQMQNSVKFNLFFTYVLFGKYPLEKWVKKWPSQCTFTASQIWFSKRITQIFINGQEQKKLNQTARTGFSVKLDQTQQNFNVDSSSNQDQLGRQSSFMQTPRQTQIIITPIEDLNLAQQSSTNNNKNTIEPTLQVLNSSQYTTNNQGAFGQPKRAFQKESVFVDEFLDEEMLKDLERCNLLDKDSLNLEQPFKLQMELYLAELNEMIQNFTRMIKGKLKKNPRISTVNLITAFVYFRDTLCSLIKDQITSVDDFKWQMQLKFQFKDLGNRLQISYEASEDEEEKARMRVDTQKIDVICEVFGSERLYGFEYLGNSQRLVVTPLTERCQRALLIALHYYHGGAPEGPVGTGKTETTKDLGRQLAKLCFVMNCSANFDYNSVVRFFKGLASSGTWVCFDEFNRMDPHILSIISQVIISIQGAIQKQSPSLIIDETKISIRPDCAIFITLNPGYAGRTELPLNLKNLFRPISMVVPDSVFITEILLYSAGFINAQLLAKKIVSILQLAQKMIHKNDFDNDFGLRTIKAIVNIAESLKMQSIGISVNELSYIIDDRTMKKMAHKSTDIIKEFLFGESSGNLPEDNQSLQNDGSMIRIDEDGNIDDPEDQRSGSSIQQISVFRNNLPPIKRRTGILGRRRGERKISRIFERVYGSLEKVEELEKEMFFKLIGLDPLQKYSDCHIEDQIILKSIRDFNHSKLCSSDNQIFDGIIKDIFKQSDKEFNGQLNNYGNLRNCIHGSFLQFQLDFSQSMLEKVLQFYEIQQVKHGVLIVGQAQSGKSTIIKLLETALNKSSMNELNLLIAEKRKAKLKDFTKDIDELRKTKTSFRRTGQILQTQVSQVSMGSDSTTKKQSKVFESKATRATNILNEVYKKTKLSIDELKELKHKMMIKGVSSKRINPKSMTINEMFGNFEEESHSWEEGIFTQIFKDFSLEHSSRKKWIILDGPIDSIWVENLNSILDDNKKMSLTNGESVFMSQGMALLLETDSLLNTTPATISRCGLVYLLQSEYVNPKSLLNSWMRSLPQNLHEYLNEIDLYCTYLLAEAFQIFDNQREKQNLLYYNMDRCWLIKTFIKLMNSFLFDFRADIQRIQQQEASGPVTQINSGPNSRGQSQQRDRRAVDHQPSLERILESREVSEAPSRGQVFSRESAGQDCLDGVDILKPQRIPYNMFLQDEIRYENALKFAPLWIEAFIIFSIIWTFGSVMNDQGKKDLDQKLKEKINGSRTDFMTYQKNKKKNNQAGGNLTTEQNADSKSQIQMNFENQSIMAQSIQSQTAFTEINTGQSFISDFEDQLPEIPKFMSEIPSIGSLFDIYFSLDQSQWVKFNIDREINSAIVNYHSLPESLKRVQNLFVPTIETIKYSYLLEILAVSQQSTIIIGPPSTGKTELLRQALLSQIFTYSDNFSIDHMTMSCTSNSNMVKKTLERKLELKMNDSDKSRFLKPANNKKLIVYVDDLHMPERDSHGQQSANEVFRDYFTIGGWHLARNKKYRQVVDLTIFGILSTLNSSNLLFGNPNSIAQVSQRILHNFAAIGIDEARRSVMKHMFQIIIGLISLKWSSDIQQHSSKTLNALLEIYNSVLDNLKPTPMKVHYLFNWKDLFKICSGMMLVETNYLKDQINLMKLLYHESMRVFTDKMIISSDVAWITEKMKEICIKNFDLKKKKPTQLLDQSRDRRKSSLNRDQRISKQDDEPFKFPIQNPQELFFSIFNSDVEGFYVEVEQVEAVGEVLERLLFKYNDSSERQHINLILFNEINKIMMKITRVLSTSHGHLLIIALKGSGISTLQKLASFSQGYHHKELEMIPGFTQEEWRLDLKKLLLKAGSEDKHVVFGCDQFKVQQEEFYNDLACILNNNISSDILSHSDIDQSLSIIHQQLKTEKLQKAQKQMTQNTDEDNNGEGGYHERDQKDIENEEKRKRQTAMSMQQQAKQIIYKSPVVHSEMYNYLLKRIKNNFHLILSYSPTGEKFKERLMKHQTFLTCCTLIWIQDFSKEALENLGSQFIEFTANKDRAPSQMKTMNLFEQRQNEVEKETKQAQEKLENKRIMQSCVKMYLDSKEMAKRFFSETDQILYFTPSLFINMFSNYRRLYEERKKSVVDIQKRYETGLERIRLTQLAIQEYHLELEKKTPGLQERQRELIAHITKAEEKFNGIKKSRDLVKREEFMLQQECEQALQIKLQCEEALNKVIPALNEAVNSIQSLSKHDLSELKAMKKPPKVIKLVLKAVCILLQVPPARKKCKDGIHFKDSYWASAQSKDILGNSRLPDMLVEYDRNKITQEMMLDIEEIVNHPDYTYENAYRASKAATGMFKWVKAIREYFYIFKEIEPRRDAFMMSEKQYSIKCEELTEKRKDLIELESRLSELTEIQQVNDEQAEALKIEINDCKVKKKRADTLLRSLGSEKQKWIVCTRMLSGKYLTVNGDVLLSSAYISLLSGFTNKYRNKLIKKWRRTLDETGLPVSDNFSFNDLFGDSMRIRDWAIHGLPQDQFSINNAIILEKSKKYCICIDPQYQAQTWLKSQFYEQGLIVTKYQDSLFKKSLEMAIEMGKPVLVENIGDKIETHVYTLLQKDIIKHGNSRLIKFGRKTFKFDKSFNLFLITSYKNPHFDVNISNISTIVNFYVTFDGLQQQMLSLVVANERHDLEERFVENTKEAFENIKSLREIENAILEQLQMEVEKLLSDEILIKTLNESRNTAEFIASKLKNISSTAQFMQKSRDLFSPVSKRAALLYFVVADLSKVNPMYHFSLSQFTQIFVKSMEITNQFKPSDERHQKRQNKNSFAFVSQKLSHEDRIDMLIQTFTHELYKKVCSSIYEKDRALFTNLMVFRILEFEEYLDKNLYQFLLGGPRNPDYSEEAPKDLNLNWINTRSWGDLRQLSLLKPFNINNLVEHIKSKPADWNLFYSNLDFSFDKLPNKVKLNISSMLPQEIQAQVQEEEFNDITEQSGVSFQIDKSLMISKTDTNDDGPHTDDNRPLTRNVSSVLNDEDLWRVSSDSEDEPNYKAGNAKKKGLDQEDQEFLNQEEEMAMYLVDSTPMMTHDNGGKGDKVKQTLQEQEVRIKKEQVLKCLIELCLLRCIRPDKISESMNNFLKIVINTKYTSFDQDILSKYKQVIAIEDPSKPKISPRNTKNQLSPRVKVSGFMQILKDAYDDSSKKTPLFFLITHSVHVYGCLVEFQRTFQENQVKLQYLSLGKGLEKRVEEKIMKASQAGDWLLLENLHLVVDWLTKLEEIIIRLDKQEVNPRFRLWLSSVAVENFPPNILQLSIKVSLQPPSGIKQIMDRMVNKQNQDIFRKSRQNANIHKNLFFCLIYFHSNLEGRKKYGSLGWNIPYQFDFADIEISASQLLKLMRRELIDDETNLKMIKYLIGDINYAGKLQRTEDEIILKSIINDLFSKDLAFNKFGIDSQPIESHYGLPSLAPNHEFQHYSDFIDKMPDYDYEDIFGFNNNIERLYQKNSTFAIFRQVNQLNTKSVPFNNPLDIKTKDENDSKVKEIALGLMKTLPQLFSLKMIEHKFPLTHEDPFTTLIHREVYKYNGLLNVIKNSLIDLVNTIDGKISSTQEMEKLWYQILFNYVPGMWLNASYPTCYRNLGDYIVNLNDRLQFIRDWLENGIKDQKLKKFDNFENDGRKSIGQLTNSFPSFWFPGFFDQNTFLTVLRQQRSRMEGVELEQIENIYEIMQFKSTKSPSLEPYTVFVHGLWLEGAQWNLEVQSLEETSSNELYLQFPVIKIKTIKIKVNSDESETQEEKNDYFNCPVYKTTMRLGNTIAKVETDPITHIPLKSAMVKDKWIKRGVALILDIHN